MLKGYRSWIAFLVGTALTIWLVILSKESNYVSLLTVWVGIMSAFLTKNLLQSKENQNDGTKE